jgi:hypothetical protein
MPNAERRRELRIHVRISTSKVVDGAVSFRLSALV